MKLEDNKIEAATTNVDSLVAINRDESTILKLKITLYHPYYRPYPQISSDNNSTAISSILEPNVLESYNQNSEKLNPPTSYQ